MINGKGRWALIVHGGAKEMAPGEKEDNLQGCAEALEAGHSILTRGGSAVDAVEASIRALEGLPVFNCGYGSCLNEQGEVEMCAALMDGGTLDVGAVAALMGVRHPISVAREMLREETVLLAGDGAYAFARDRGVELCDPTSLIISKRIESLARECDTVGAVAFDMNGNLAAATSTGGLTGSPKGRVGDSPLPGCGFYADNHIGAVVLSGHGEGLMRIAAAAQIMAAIGRDGPEAAIAKALKQMNRVDGDGGGAAINCQGEIGWWHNSPDFPVAFLSSDRSSPQVFLKKEEEAVADHA